MSKRMFFGIFALLVSPWVGLSDAKMAEAIHPGVDQPQLVKVLFKDGVLELAVPLHRGCAMVRLTPGERMPR